ncbi:hypothetical protein [Pseudobacillus badius]|uniref:hypothetical protein n=1 Tax=Bacillus badius TaxID=1455 RepID=UPI003D33518C
MKKITKGLLPALIVVSIGLTGCVLSGAAKNEEGEIVFPNKELYSRVNVTALEEFINTNRISVNEDELKSAVSSLENNPGDFQWSSSIKEVPLWLFLKSNTFEQDLIIKKEKDLLKEQAEARKVALKEQALIEK